MSINKFIIKTCTKIIPIIRILHQGLQFNRFLAKKVINRIKIFKFKQFLINTKIINLKISLGKPKILPKICKIKAILNLNSEIKNKKM